MTLTALLVGVLLHVPVAAAAPEPPARPTNNSDFASSAVVTDDQSAMDVNLRTSEAKAAAARAVAPAERLIEYERAPMCNTSSGRATTPLNGPCPEAQGEAGVNDCEGDTPLQPMWARERASVATQDWGPWFQVDAG
ncbi:hypothetical protein J4037_17115, partial [Cellulomonas sp. zg-ZUI168]|nr:hypothetical protein [Cellulomonas fengjieae]